MYLTKGIDLGCLSAGARNDPNRIVVSVRTNKLRKAIIHAINLKWTNATLCQLCFSWSGFSAGFKAKVP